MGEKVSIRDSPNHGGKGMFATSFIGLDEEVASVWHPLVAILDTDRLKDTCYYCLTSPEMPSLVMEADQKDKGGSDGELKKCSACKIVRYCSKVRASVLSKCFKQLDTYCLEGLRMLSYHANSIFSVS